MNDDNEVLKAQIEADEQDLIFYLRNYRELSARSKYMAAVVEKEIARLENSIKQKRALL